MNRKTGKILTMLLLSASFLLSGCSKSDDVLDILTGRVWHLTYNPQNLSKLFTDETEYEKALQTLNEGNNYTIAFQGAETNGAFGGTFSARASNASFSGTWRADGVTRELSLVVQTTSGSETNALGKEFVRCIHNVTKYEGNDKSLLIYYKNGNSPYLGFTPKNQ